ncbi:MAG: hypothetical protein UV75_C0010G0021 [Candidatus Giovannonibacteria bacterium GW2011_GWA1_43_15]|nr:MAG: hypothetical protein UV75_C0010G0021 [Candidatus Giovannonibacteria bacterium GW2011_GWA1_43_15]
MIGVYMEERSPRAVLLTGGTGFIGSFLGLRLLEEGYYIFFLVRKAEKDSRSRVLERLSKISYLTARKYENAWEIVEGDTSLPFFGIDKAKLNELKNKVNKIFHCAALLSFDPRNKDKAHKINIEGAKNATELALLFNVELHYLSTAYIAGDRRGEIKEDEFDEGQSFRNVYEKTKFEAEKVVRSWGDKGGRYIIYRPSIVIGDSETGLAFSFTGYYMVAKFFWRYSKFFKRMEGKKFHFPIIIPVVKSATLNLITVDAVVDAIYKLSQKTESIGRTFHIVHPNPPKTSFVFKNSINVFGFSNVKIWLVPLYILRLIAWIGWALSFLFARIGYSFRQQISTYVPYFDGSSYFSYKGVGEVLGNSYLPAPIDVDVIKRVLLYAKENKFSDIKN